MKALLVLAGAALAFATPAAAQLVNGSFETGSFSGWTQTGNTNITGVTCGSLGGTAPSSGSCQARFGQVFFVGGITQSLATTAGQNYLITFDLTNLSGDTPNFYEVLFDGVQLFSATDTGVFGYTNFSTNAIASSATTALTFNFRHDPDYFLLDNVSVTAINGAVPEPATWAMMLIGFGAIGASMRRRRNLTATPQFA